MKANKYYTQSRYILLNKFSGLKYVYLTLKINSKVGIYDIINEITLIFYCLSIRPYRGKNANCINFVIMIAGVRSAVRRYIKLDTVLTHRKLKVEIAKQIQECPWNAWRRGRNLHFSHRDEIAII